MHDLLSHLNAHDARPTRRLAVLGASGSVGGTTVRYLAGGESGIELSVVSVHGSVERLTELLGSFPSIRLAGISSEQAYEAHHADLARRFPHCRFFRGEEGLVDLVHACADAGVDTALTAVVGACGIHATIACLERGMKIALANKETMVTAGPVLEPLLERQRTGRSTENVPCIVPVDSEHNALFQLLAALRPDHLERVVLTASGGPFRDLDPGQLVLVTRDEVLNHPTWSMGPKITVDSAGMINKGLELIEARFLFALPYEQLAAVIHRDSIAHALVETTDGGYLIAASAPDMVFPAAHALHYPDSVPRRHASARLPEEWSPLAFAAIDPARYPGFELCKQAARLGGTAPAVLNAANETAVDLFLEGAIAFVQIPQLIERVMQALPVEQDSALELFLEADQRARAQARQSVATLVQH